MSEIQFYDDKEFGRGNVRRPRVEICEGRTRPDGEAMSAILGWSMFVGLVLILGFLFGPSLITAIREDDARRQAAWDALPEPEKDARQREARARHEGWWQGYMMRSASQ